MAAIQTSGDQRRTRGKNKQRKFPLNKNNSRRASMLYGCFISTLFARTRNINIYRILSVLSVFRVNGQKRTKRTGGFFMRAHARAFTLKFNAVRFCPCPFLKKRTRKSPEVVRFSGPFVRFLVIHLTALKQQVSFSVFIYLPFICPSLELLLNGVIVAARNLRCDLPRRHSFVGRVL